MKPVTRNRTIFAAFDLCLVAACSLFTACIHDGISLKSRNTSYLFAFLLFPVLWVFLSILTRKFRIGERSSQMDVLISVLFSNFVILSITTIVMILFRLTFFSRFILFGTVSAITLIELMIGIVYVSLRRSVFIRDWIGLDIPEQQRLEIAPPPLPETMSVPKNVSLLRDLITEESGTETFTWISSQLDLTDPRNLIVSTDSRFNIINQPAGFLQAIVNLHRINDFRRINKFFEAVNARLPSGGIFIGCADTNELRKERILGKYPPVINFMVYTIDFILHRIFPKVIMTRKLYFLVTRGKKRVISRAETLGRLYSCGFEVVMEQHSRGLLYWKACKIRTPYFDTDPTYGLFIRLHRIGLNGKEFSVYKLRTMHAYAEYLQGYVYDHNLLDKGGKFRDDFRVTTMGKVFRKLWIDELPMLLNVMKGDMKIVGIRPLSKHYFNLYSEDLRKKRIRVKPGLIPPFYAQFPTPSTIEEVQQNELEYLEAYDKRPFRTDLAYFFRAFRNIVFRCARSR